MGSLPIFFPKDVCVSSKHFPSLTDRAAEAAKARQAALEKFKKKAEDPETAKRRQEMAEASLARDQRRDAAEEARRQRIEDEKIEKALKAEQERIAAKKAAMEAAKAALEAAKAQREKEADEAFMLQARRYLALAAMKAAARQR